MSLQQMRDYIKTRYSSSTIRGRKIDEMPYPQILAIYQRLIRTERSR